MTFHRAMTREGRRLTRPVGALLSLALALGVVVSLGLTSPQQASASTEPSDSPGELTCGSTVTPAPPEPREINLVIDDSGSMFAGSASGPALDRWSQAKYSLEVFAAMLDTGDTLNVYRMSDFDGTADAAPAVTLKGSEPASSRVGKIHDMQLQGGGTPYAPVTKAYSDLVGSSSTNKWLVILSDGAFENQNTQQVEADLLRFAGDNTSENASLRVAFLAIGDAAPSPANAPQQGVFSEKAAASTDLLGRMTYFSNLIFERNVLTQAEPGKISPDIDLNQVMVFAQGPDVAIGHLEIGGTTISPSSEVEVAWTNNQDAAWGASRVPAVPNQSLHGTLSTFQNVPSGSGAFDIAGAETVDVYYKPDVNFGVVLQDVDGRPVDASKIIAGDYTLYYGFMDEDCNFIESPLLGDIAYSAKVLRDGEVVADAFQSGDTLDLARGSVQLDVRARYLGENTAASLIDLTVLQAARPTGFEIDDPVFQVSKLGTYAPPDGAIAITYGLTSTGDLTPFTQQEWAEVTSSTFTVTTEADIDFEVLLDDEPGRIYLVPQAPGGDIYRAATGEVPFTLTASLVFDEQLYEAGIETTTTIEDDLSWWDRFVHWFGEVGWWVLLLLILLILILGYIIKPRFSRRVKRKPVISGVPMSVNARAEEGRGKFTVQTGRKFLPFVADTATYTYVPAGVSGFRPMKLKAKRGGKMQLTNWKNVAERKNVAVNSTDLNEETTRMPMLGPSTNVTATVPQQIRYESYLNT